MAVDNTCLSLGTQDLTCCSWNAIRPLLSSSSARNSSRSLQELLVWRRKWTGAQLWKKELGLIVLIRVPNLPDVSRRTGGGCPGRRPLMTATWGSICSKVDIDGTCICLSTCVTITGNYCLFVCLSSTCLMWRTLTAVLGHYTQLIFAWSTNTTLGQNKTKMKLKFYFSLYHRIKGITLSFPWLVSPIL